MLGLFSCNRLAQIDPVYSQIAACAAGGFANTGCQLLTYT